MTQPTVRAGVAAIVTREHHLLMLLRNGKHGSGTWSLPGGWMEFGESFYDTAEREVKEETSVDIQPTRWRHITNDFFPGDSIHAITVFVDSIYIAGEPYVMEPDKCPEVRWVPLREVTKLPLFEPLVRWIDEDGFVDGFGRL